MAASIRLSLYETGLASMKGLAHAIMTKLAGLLIAAGTFLAGYILYSRKRYYKNIRAMERELVENRCCLQLLEEDRDWLINELHHRVKNNLQMMISLLNTQSSYLTNQEAFEAIKNSQHRMYAMSLVHQQLYRADRISVIDIDVYIHELVEYLKAAYESSGRVRFHIDITKLELDVSLAIPLGLIMSEALSNSLKYAFEGRPSGEISISGSKTDKGEFVLRIADNGIGLRDDFDVHSQNSLGISLMAGLSGQLGGTYNMTVDKGVLVTVEFKVPPPPNPDHLKIAL